VKLASCQILWEVRAHGVKEAVEGPIQGPADSGHKKTESCIGFEGKSLHCGFLFVGVMKRWGTSSWSDYTTVETACDRFCGDGCPVGS
jgi:hypothetical protein